MESQQYYIQLRGRVYGPFSAAELASRAKRGQFARHYGVSTDTVHWKRAGEFPELFPTAAPDFGIGDDHSVPTEEQYPIQGDFPASRVSPPHGAPPAAVEQEWFYAKEGQECGPVSAAQVRALLNEGRLSSADQVWTHGMSAWQPISAVPNLTMEFKIPSLPSEHKRTVSSSPSHSSLTAIASLVFGILGISPLVFLGSILAVAFGHTALRQIEESEGTLTGRGIAIAGLVLGYVVLIPGAIALFIFSIVAYVAAHHG